MPKNVLLYKNQQETIINKLLEILDINDTNRIFSLHKLDNDTIKQEKILGLEDDIKKYFNCSTWSCFKHKNQINRRWLSFIKYLFKVMNIKLVAYRNNNDDSTGTIYLISL